MKTDAAHCFERLLAQKSVSELKQATKPCIEDHPFMGEDVDIAGEFDQLVPR